MTDSPFAFVLRASARAVSPPPPSPPPPSAPEFRASSLVEEDETGEATISVPTGAQTGDLLVLFVTGGADASNVVSTPSGWTSIGDQVDAGAGGHLVGRAFYRVREAGDAASVDVEITGFGVDNILAWMLAYEAGSFDAADPVDGTPAVNSSEAGTATAVGLSVTTTEDSSLLLMGILTREGTAASAPDGMTERAANSFESFMAWEEEIESAGATGNRESALAGSIPWITWTAAIKGA